MASTHAILPSDQVGRNGPQTLQCDLHHKHIIACKRTRQSTFSDLHKIKGAQQLVVACADTCPSQPCPGHATHITTTVVWHLPRSEVPICRQNSRICPSICTDEPTLHAGKGHTGDRKRPESLNLHRLSVDTSATR